MQTKTKWVGFSAVALAALLASCGSDDGDSENGSGGSSSNTSGSGSGGSGAGKAGATGTAGSGKAGSGTGGKVGGGGTTGGSNPGTAGFNFGGNFNLGGAGFDPDEYACDPAPTPGADCESDAQPCLDGADVCYCGNDAQWACMNVLGGGGGGAGPGALECPATKPASGSACTGQGICPYGGQNEGCACYAGMWTCIP